MEVGPFQLTLLTSLLDANQPKATYLLKEGLSTPLFSIVKLSL